MQQPAAAFTTDKHVWSIGCLFQMQRIPLEAQLRTQKCPISRRIWVESLLLSLLTGGEYIISKVKLLLGLTVLLFIASCATAKGPKFSGLDTVTAGKANLYVYFLVNEKRANAATTGFDIVINDIKKDTLGYQSYVVYAIEPGEYVIAVGENWASKKQVRVNLKAEAGKNYFVRYDDSGSYDLYAMGYKYKEVDMRRVEFKSETQAIAELSRLKRLN